MRYYKNIENGYITAIGTGGGGTEIAEGEYGEIMYVIQSKPPRTETTDYHLKTDLTWEAYEREPDVPSDDPPDNLDASIEYLVSGRLIAPPTEEADPDYLNEREPEPEYFS